VLVRLRFSEQDPGEVTGYAVGLPNPAGSGGEPTWLGGGRLAPELSLPRLRRRWKAGIPAGGDHSARWEFTGSERDAIFEHAARQAAIAAEHVRWHALGDPALAADAAYATADAVRVAARVTRSRVLRHAADRYDRAARAPYGRIPRHTPEGNRLRAMARLVALTGQGMGGDAWPAIALLVVQLAELVAAVAELRQAQQHPAQAAAARSAADRLHTVSARPRRQAPRPGQAPSRPPSRAAADVAQRDVPARAAWAGRPGAAPARPARPGLRHRPLPPRRAGPGR